tara:strand:+ start:9793 stop:11736 length:1944 start_codon:yes stop_codon:yes gene_type:complete
MKLEVVGWKYRNVRGGIRDIEIDLSSAPRWTFLQMPNGTGKTTTMTLLRAALTGEEPTPEQISDLKADDETQEGSFELRLLVDGERYTIRLDFDYLKQTVAYSTRRAGRESGGEDPGLLLPPRLKRLLTPEFTRLFIFDGELAKEIRSESKDRTTKSIRALYRLDQLDVLQSKIEDLVKKEREKSADLTSAIKQQGVTRLQNNFDKAHSRCDELEDKVAALRTKKDGATKRLSRVKGQIKDRELQNERFKERRRALDERLNGAQAELEGLSRSTHDILRSPSKVGASLHRRLAELGTRLTTLKLPKTISHEFFKELAQADNCVCGTAIGPTEKKAILEGAERYLAEDQITVINRMKQSIREGNATGDELVQAAIELKAKLREVRVIEQEIGALEQEQIDAGDSELAELIDERRQIEKEIPELEDKIKDIASTDPAYRELRQLTWKDNLPLARQHRADCERKLAAATNTLRYSEAAAQVKEVVASISSTALGNLRESVRASTNEKLRKLGKGETLEVTKIGAALELGAPGSRHKGGVSEGQSLSVAYAFISSLLSAAPFELPFIVDSPAVSLDLEVRREVGEIVPGLFDQMIMFVISTEREGFSDAFETRDGVEYITIWRDGEGNSQMRTGKDFFARFHSDEDEEQRA